MRVNCLVTTIVFSLLFSVCPLSASTVLTGNSGSETTTFDFSVGPVIFPAGANLSVATAVTGADEEKSDNIYSLAAYSPAASQFIPVGVSSVTLNNVEDQSNPLKAQKIKFLSSYRNMNDVIIYCTCIDKETITTPVPQSERFYKFSLELPDTTKPTETKVDVVQSDVPNDAEEETADYIVGMTSLRVRGAQELIVGAATPHDSSAFGAGASGITAAHIVKEKAGYVLKMLDLASGEHGNKALSFTGGLSELKVGNDATILNVVRPYVDMHWDTNLQRLYIAVSVTAAGTATDGARSIVVGRFDNGKLIFQKLVPDDAVTGGSNTNIIAAKEGGSLFASKVRTMRTTTGLDYLIVNGGNGTIGTVANRVYALPLTNLQVPGEANPTWKTDDGHGVAANVNSSPTTNYNEVSYRYRTRSFRTKAESESDLFTSSSEAALVGAGTIPFILDGSMTIKDMFVRDDAVYVSVAGAYDYDNPQIQQPGIYHSKAIFDHEGKVAAWTPWQRVGGSDDRSYGSMLDASRGDFWYLTGEDDNNVNTVKKTSWGRNDEDGLLGGTTTDSSVGLVNLISQQFQGVYGGASAMQQFDAHNNNRGIPNSGLTGVTTMLVSGFEKTMFIKTGVNSGATGTIKPYTGDFATDLASNTRGAFPSGSGKTFVMSGGALEGMGPLVANTIFSNGTYSWIAVGGVNGVAILSGSSGEGFDASSMPTGFTFKRIGDYKFVRKIVSDGYYLYVLTNKVLDRIVINPASFASGGITKTTIARASELCGWSRANFSDIIVGDKLAILATSKGLYRIANNSSIRGEIVYWSYVPLNESVGAINSLSFSSSSTDLNSGIANGSQIYALSAYQGYDSARIYRFYSHEGSSISDSSFQNIGDVFIEGTPSYFWDYGQMRTTYTDDGSVRFSTRPSSCGRDMGLFTLSPFVQVGSTAFSSNPERSISGDFGTTGSFGKVIRLSSSGAWLVNGNFGLRVNE